MRELLLCLYCRARRPKSALTARMSGSSEANLVPASWLQEGVVVTCGCCGHAPAAVQVQLSSDVARAGGALQLTVQVHPAEAAWLAEVQVIQAASTLALAGRTMLLSAAAGSVHVLPGHLLFPACLNPCRTRTPPATHLAALRCV